MNGRLTQGAQLADCKVKTTRIEDDVIVMNRNDIAFIGHKDNVVDYIQLRPGKVAFRFTGLQDCFSVLYQLQTGKYSSHFRHGLRLEMLSRTQDCKSGLSEIKDSRLIAIIKNRDDNEQTRYELLGLRNGLEAESIIYDSSNTDCIIADISLMNAEGRMEALPPASVWSGSLAETELMLESLFGRLLFTLDIHALGSAYRLG